MYIDFSLIKNIFSTFLGLCTIEFIFMNIIEKILYFFKKEKKDIEQFVFRCLICSFVLCLILGIIVFR